MQVDRLFKIIYILMEHKLVPAKVLAEKMEVSVRTIYRDIDTLSGAGIPVYAVAGRGGGVALMDRFVLNKSTISEDEQNQILMALQNLSVAEYLETDNVLSKLSGFFQKQDTKWIEVDYSNWGSSHADRQKFDLLKQVILDKSVISFFYFDSYGKKSRRIADPLRLVFKARSWYLQGYCHMRADYRTFKLSRIYDVEVEEQHFEHDYSKIPSIIEHRVEWGVSIQVQLRFEEYIAFRVYDEFAESEVVKQEDGTFLVNAQMEDGDWIFEYLLSFGPAVEILQPQHLRKQMVERIEAVRKKYLTVD